MTLGFQELPFLSFRGGSKTGDLFKPSLHMRPQKWQTSGCPDKHACESFATFKPSPGSKLKSKSG